ncbi:MAG TPA: rhodanese-like domain-containing protein [Phycisphaerales bacterium]
MSSDRAGLASDYNFKPDWEVTPVEAKRLLDSGAAVLVIDVRLDPEWDFARVPSTVHVPLDELESRADEIRELAEKTPGCQVLALCHHGVRSMKAAAYFRSIGLANAKSIAGGIEAWSKGADPGVPRYERQGSSVWPAKK